MDDHFVIRAGQMRAMQLAIGIGAGVSRVLEDAVDGRKRRPHPGDRLGIRRTVPAGKLDGLVAQDAQDFVGAAQALELGEHQADDTLDLLIGVEDDALLVQAHQTDGQAQVQLAAFGLVEFSGAQLGA